jgi:tryptophan synthase alpha chain
MSGIEAIAEAFARARADGRAAALMPYMMGGFPDPAQSVEIGLAYADAGADLIELGVPFSDPLADGPVIHAAATAALRAGANLDRVLEACAAVSPRVPVVIMCYANVILARGLERFADALAGAGASGLIVPDMPLEEAAPVRRACDERGLALVALVAPTTPDARLQLIGEQARGFLYTVSVTGTTGEREGVDGLAAVIARARAHSSVPVAVGFGIGTPAQAAAAAAAGADGVIVGTRLVRAAAEAADRSAEVADRNAEAADPAAAVRELVREFAAALTTNPARARTG